MDRPRCPKCSGWLYREDGEWHYLPCGWTRTLAPLPKVLGNGDRPARKPPTRDRV